ncbi:MAG: four helix bundle protein [Phycisphaerae bacterium]|jgi:four helix bundle protein|nr:four helix bundle protein [Phycisphaerae bacterium]
MASTYGESAFGFEDLEVYKAAAHLRGRCYKLANAALPDDKRFALTQQIRRAAVSMANNIAEGYGRFTWQDTPHYCRQARGSLMELVDDMNVCVQQSSAEQRHIDTLRQDSACVLKLINGYIRYLQTSKANGESDS